VARPVDERRVGGPPAAPLFMRSTGKEGRKRRRRRVEGRRGETAFSVAIQYTFVTFEWRRAVGIRGAMVINALYGGVLSAPTDVKHNTGETSQCRVYASRIHLLLCISVCADVIDQAHCDAESHTQHSY